MATPMSSPDRYVATRSGPLLVTVGLGAVCLLVAWATFSTARGDGMAPAADDPEWLGAVPYVIAGGAALLGLWALACVPGVLRHRFEIDRDGIRWRSIDLPWDRVQAVRVLVLSTTKPLVTSPTPRSARTSARVSLEVSLREPEIAEGQQPALRSRRIPGTATEGYTHHVPLGPGAVFPGSDPSTFAPEVQAVLARVAAPIFHGAVIRRTATTWTRGRAGGAPGGPGVTP